MLKRIVFVIFIYHTVLFANAQDSISTSTPQEIRYDLDTPISVQEFDREKLQKLKKQKDFDYTVYEEPDNWWTHFKNWISQLWSKLLYWLFDVGEATGFIAILLTALPYLLIIGVLFLLIWLFMKVNPSEILLEKQELPQIELTEDEDIIHNQDIQKLIHQALQHQNYRLAIRYYYLFILKRLADLEFIHWESQKTNTDYIKELEDETIKNEFRTITKLYDFIWYGNFDMNEKSYRLAEKEFQSITNYISS